MTGNEKDKSKKIVELKNSKEKLDKILTILKKINQQYHEKI
jgi:hypothetical protein